MVLIPDDAVISVDGRRTDEFFTPSITRYQQAMQARTEEDPAAARNASNAVLIVILGVLRDVHEATFGDICALIQRDRPELFDLELTQKAWIRAQKFMDPDNDTLDILLATLRYAAGKSGERDQARWRGTVPE